MATARRRLIIGFIVPSIVVAVFMHATAAQASPTITIGSPPAGQPLYDLRPTITVGYTSDDPAAPLNLATLRVTVNGFDWTGKFTAGPDSATYAVTVDDELIAGILTIAASISDTAGASASTAADYDVFPTLSALAPSTAEAGDTISLMASGLDPAPDRNKALLNPSGLTAALSDVDRSIATGRFTLPAGTTSGDVGLEVNGKVARERIQLSVPSVVPNCGEIRSLFATADGGWLVAYGADFWWKPVDPQCPPPQLVDYLTWRFVKVTPAGDLLPLALPGGVGLGFDVRIIPNKRRSDAAILKRNFSLPVVVRYKDVDTFLPGFVSAADFDRDGNLFVLFFNSGFRIYRVSKEALAQGGDATLEPIAQLPVQSGGPDPYGFVVSCDGFAYAAFNLRLNQYPWVQPRIFKVDLAARAVVGDRLLGVGEELHSLALSCQTNELWSARFLNVQENTSAAIARTEVTPNGFGISEDVFVTPAAAFPIGVAIGAGGSLYFQTGTSAVLAKRGAINACPVPTGALPVCETQEESIKILPSTTRWRPQRGNELTKVDIGSSVELDISQPFTLRYTGKKADGTVVAATTEVPLSATPLPVPPQGYAYGYTLSWNHLDSTGAKLPVGNYTLVVVAPVLTNQSPPPPPLESPEYSKVSLVEVKSVEFFQCSESICGQLGTNTNAGGGAAIYPDAAAPGGIYRRQVGVRATIDPTLNGEATDVAVYFRAIDVDDPSASTAPVDADTPSATPDNPAADNYGECAGTNDPCVAPAVTGPLVNASDVSEALFFVSPYPGVNYRVAASTSATWLTDLRGKLSSTAGDVEHSNGTPLSNDPANNELAQVSEMLTVWRILNVEQKTMDPGAAGITQEEIQHNGTWTDIKGGNVIHKPEGIKDADHAGNDDWVGAYLRPAVTDPNATEMEPALPDGQTVYFVDDSKKDSASVEGSLQPFLTSANQKYYLRDDELANFTTRQHNLTFLTDLLRPAYIEVDTQHNPVPLITWTRRLTPETLNSVPRLPSNAAGWSIPAVLAFEAQIAGNSVYKNEHDNKRPSNVKSSGVLGLTCGGGPLCQLPADQPIAATFVETIRDFAWTDRTSIKATVPAEDIYGTDLAHEVLHSLGLWHNGGIMCSTRKNNASDPMRYKITDQQLALLRKLSQPHVVEDRWDSCTSVAEPNCCPDPQ